MVQRSGAWVAELALSGTSVGSTLWDWKSWGGSNHSGLAILQHVGPTITLLGGFDPPALSCR